MKTWKAKNNPIPEKTDTNKMKEFFRIKYVEKRFAEAEEDSDSSDSEAERRRRKKRKEKKAKKAAAKKAAASDSSEEEQSAAAKVREEQKNDDDSDDGDEPIYKAKNKQRKRGLGAPPGQSKVAKPQAASPPSQQP